MKKITTFFQNKIEIEIENLDSKIENIVNTTNFQFLKKQEQKYGFSESTTYSDFFRKGTSNQWKEILTKKQAERIENAFKPLMERLGYI